MESNKNANYMLLLCFNLFCFHFDLTSAFSSTLIFQTAANLNRSLTLREINLLKVILCSGLYPQLAIADDCNSYRKDSDQVFHTKVR